MKLLHLTDTHFTRPEDLLQFPDELANVFKQQMSFEKKLHKIIAQEELDTFDFVVITGDLVHECKADAYEAYFNTLNETFGDLPIYFVTGNHDLNVEFYKARQESYQNNYFDYDFVRDGIHFIILDSSEDDRIIGSFTDKQVERLEATLAENKLPKFIFLHHPLFGWKESDIYSIQDSQAVTDLLTQYDIIGLLTGHTHQLGIHVHKNLVQHTSYHFGFGISHVNAANVMEINNLTGYSVIEYTEDQILSIRPRIIHPCPTPLFRLERS